MNFAFFILIVITVLSFSWVVFSYFWVDRSYIKKYPLHRDWKPLFEGIPRFRTAFITYIILTFVLSVGSIMIFINQ